MCDDVALAFYGEDTKLNAPPLPKEVSLSCSKTSNDIEME